MRLRRVFVETRGPSTSGLYDSKTIQDRTLAAKVRRLNCPESRVADLGSWVPGVGSVFGSSVSLKRYSGLTTLHPTVELGRFRVFYCTERWQDRTLSSSECDTCLQRGFILNRSKSGSVQPLHLGAAVLTAGDPQIGSERHICCTSVEDFQHCIWSE